MFSRNSLFFGRHKSDNNMSQLIRLNEETIGGVSIIISKSLSKKVQIITEQHCFQELE